MSIGDVARTLLLNPRERFFPIERLGIEAHDLGICEHLSHEIDVVRLQLPKREAGRDEDR